MKIGIPRALFYYRYQTLIKTFLNELDIDYIISDPTTKQTLENGNKLAPPESCISLKIFLGHIKNLINKCDYILIPHIESLKKDEKVCTNFYLLYDLVNNLFNINILDINIDETHKKKEKKVQNNLLLKQTNILNNNNKKILLAGHPYNIYDELIGKPIINILKENNIDIVYADIYDKKGLEKESKEISKDTYYTINKELMGAIAKYKNNVNGIIIISAFPCATDSITNELIIRNIKNKPIITIIQDEETETTGLITRLESFIDIINKENTYE